MSRHYSSIDQVIMRINDGVATLFSGSKAKRANPAEHSPEPDLTSQEKKQSIGYMRVNHTGEVCAQALYQGQSVTAKNESTREMLEQAAREETDHLAWCHQRLIELNGHRSVLNPVWFASSFLMGIVAGLAGDQWSLGFVEETEKQVEAHLNYHLNKISPNDHKSREIVQQMKEEEIHHGESAKKAGAGELPFPVKKLMSLHSKVMTTVAYWV